MSEKILIVMPCYNVQDFVIEALESVIKQEYIHYKLVCCDDASTDDTLKILKENKLKYNYELIENQYNTGTGETVNKIINSYVDSEDFSYITWISADNILLSNFLSEHIKKLNQGFAISYSKFKYYSNDSISSLDQNLMSLKNRVYLLGASFVFRIKLWNKIKKFHKLPGEDVYFAVEAALNNAKFGYIEEITMLYRDNNPQSLTNRMISDPSIKNCTAEAFDLANNIQFENGDLVYD